MVFGTGAYKQGAVVRIARRMRLSCIRNTTEWGLPYPKLGIGEYPKDVEWIFIHIGLANAAGSYDLRNGPNKKRPKGGLPWAWPFRLTGPKAS